ncbi:uncharacterized protein LTR77_000863 [Saxophila tyrrhenica]|uniref:DUF1772-domain-containing protein n=1 Tax=Saxophila tyrrhenica TaxID=1690608 RepID=A0AAV9PP84_9PEZI|nr:hypothetical protein LTR77_000863 [Saxophila tyrrhenica]
MDPIRTATFLSFPPALILTGYTLSFSHSTVPALYDHKPQQTTPIFRLLSTHSSALIPTLTLLSTSASAYLAYVLPEQRREWTTAAAAMFLTVPWRALMMGKGEKRLVEISKEERVRAKSEMTLEHRQLMIRWVKMNWVNVVLGAVSGVTGLMAVVGRK